MIKIFLLLACFFAGANVYSQQTDTTSLYNLSKEQLLQKSRTQRTIGWIMIGTGAPVVAATTYFMTFPDDVIEKDKVVLALLGSAVYTFIGFNLIKTGKKNREDALSLHLKKILLPAPAPTVHRMQPAVSVSLRF
jgi:hypothetical protein